MNLNAKFKAFTAQLKNGDLYWRDHFPCYFLNQEPFSGINAFLLGTSPQCSQSPYWLDDLDLQRLNASLKAENAEMIVDFTEIADSHYKLRNVPLYNLSQLSITANINTKTPPTLHEIIAQCRIPYELANVENTAYKGSNHALQIPNYAKKEDPSKFFKALAEFLYYNCTSRPYQNSAFVLDYLSSLLAVHFRYTVKFDSKSYIIQQLSRLDLENNTENQNEFLGSLNFCSQLLDELNAPLPKFNQENDQKLLNALDLILPPITKQELIRSLTSVQRKKTLKLLNELIKSFNAMQSSQRNDLLYFHYVLPLDGLQFYLCKIDDADNYHGIMISADRKRKYHTVLDRAELDELELDLNFTY